MSDWRIDWATYGGPYIREPGQAMHAVAKVYCGHFKTFEEKRKRAALLSAAPELLEALQEMLNTHGKPMRDEWMNEAAFEHAKKVDEMVKAAIAKAEGRS